MDTETWFYLIINIIFWPILLQGNYVRENILLIFIFTVIYSVPTMIAKFSNHKQRTAIFVLNMTLGWTVIGWIIALIWSVMKE